MKFYRITEMMLWAAMLCGTISCHKESLKNIDSEMSEQRPETVELSFNFSMAPVELERRTVAEKSAVREEEGDVSSLMYAIFKNDRMVWYQEIDLSDKAIHTGKSYSVLNLKSEFFDNTTQIFALANMNDTQLKNQLMNEKDISKWKDCTYNVKLNEIAGKSDSRVVDNPVMAGYLSLNDGVTDKISIKMERIYCRIWFSFVWQNHKNSDCVIIDEIKISGLNQQSRLFNNRRYVWEDNVVEIKEDMVIKNEDTNQYPFIGSLTQYPYYSGSNTNPKLELVEQQNEDHNVLCRFTWKGGNMVKTSPPVRYYVYSLQKGGINIEHDPLIEVKYHYTHKDYGVLYKKATARLYDKSSNFGKKHHGLLRNYTYRLNCIVNTTTNTMELQVLSVPWYEIVINDIPSFE